MSISVFTPISIGNISVGFDTLGLCASPINGDKLGDTVTVSEYKTNEFQLSGNFKHMLPADKESNIIWQALLSFNQRLINKSIAPKSVLIELDKNIPVCSGLGSSACSIVSATVALNYFYNEPLNQTEMLLLMGELESQISGSLHYDNVAPLYLGGLQLMLADPNKITQSIPYFEDCYWIIAYPDIEISTKAAREVLPNHYSRQTLIEFGQNLAGFIDASYRRDKQQAFSLLKDVVAEPYRQSLLPNYKSVKQSLAKIGTLATGISGSGPTIFSVTDDKEIATQISDFLKANYLQTENGFVSVCQIDRFGARAV